MSFFSNCKNDRCPGPINGNPLNGLCEKACIQTKKIFDSCMKQTQEKGLIATITNLNPANPTLPLTFVSASSSIYDPAEVTDLSVERFEKCPNFARVQCTVNIPVTVTYTDANGVLGTGTTTVSLDEDVVLYVPQASIVPFTIEAFGSVACPDGAYVNDYKFSLNACIVVILKVVVEADLLVPSYGYCAIPQCQDYSQEVCSGSFDLPIFPCSR